MDVSDFIFLLGGGEGGVRGERVGVVSFLLQIPGGGVSREGGGASGPGGCLPKIWGGGAKYFFSGPKCPPRTNVQQLTCKMVRSFFILFYSLFVSLN